MQEAMMNVNFRKNEWKLLLETVEIADWVLHAHRIEEDPRTKKYTRLFQKIYSFLYKMGFKKLVEYDETLQRYFPTRQFEDNCESMKFIEEFENDTFWDELIHRLAIRDLLSEEGEENLKEMVLEERMSREASLCEKYYNEFHENGLKNLRLIL